MKKVQVKLLFLLFILFFLDIVRPFGYSLMSEFLFLGIIFVALHTSFIFSLFIAIIFGYFKDAFSAFGGSLSITAFILISTLIHIFRYRLLFAVKRRYYNFIKAVIVSIAIILYAFFNFACVRLVSLFLFGQFFIQSFLLALLIDYLLKNLVTVYLPESVSNRR